MVMKHIRSCSVIPDIVKIIFVDLQLDSCAVNPQKLKSVLNTKIVKINCEKNVQGYNEVQVFDFKSTRRLMQFPHTKQLLNIVM